MPMKIKRRTPQKTRRALDQPLKSSPSLLQTQEAQKWLSALQQGLSETKPKTIEPISNNKEKVFYVLYKHPNRSQDGLQIEIFLAREMPDGKIRSPQKTSLTQLMQLNYPNQMDLEQISQIESAHRLSNSNVSMQHNGYLLNGFYAEKILPLLLQTHRCHWQSLQNSKLLLGEKRKPKFKWHRDEFGNQTLFCEIKQKKTPLLALEHLWYIDIEQNQLGEVETQFPQKIQIVLSQTPQIKPEESESLQATFKQLAREFSIPEPEVISKQIIRNTPTPQIHLLRAKLKSRNNPINPWEINENEEGLLELCFSYDDFIFPWHSFSKKETQLKGDVFFEIERNLIEENQFLKQLIALIGEPIKSQSDLFSLNPKLGFYFLIHQAQWQNMMNAILPLANEGWHIQTSADFPYQILELPKPDWYSEVSENQSSWFDLELGILLNGEKINILPILKNLLDELSISDKNHFFDAPSILVKLPNKQYISLPTQRIQSILTILLDLHEFKSLKSKSSVRFNKWDVGKLLELENTFQKTPLHWIGSKRVLDLCAQFKNLSNLPTISPPKTFNGTLRSYQLSGITWLQFLRTEELGGILADDMGLGKTIQALSHIALEKESKRMDLPCLIVTPTSLVFNWESEIKKFFPTLSCLVLYGQERKKQFNKMNQYDIVITSYALLLRDQEILCENSFYLTILDEAQYIKNSKSQGLQIASRIQTKHRLCLTGTPIENHLGEIWSLFHFLMPGFLGEERHFNQYFRIPIEKRQDAEKFNQLKLRASPFILRRTKEKVLPELPEKIEMLRHIELEGSQRDLYETYRITLQKELQEEIERLGFQKTHIMILHALLKLRQICCDPRLLKQANSQYPQLESAKLNFLMDFLPDRLQEGRRILLFSQFTEMLALIEAELLKKEIPYVKLTGQTQDRETPVKQFQEGKVPLFLISLKAGGTGLNLTAADTVIHYDPWWNPAIERQASDRAHRIGQDKTVFIYKLIAKGTLEEKMLELQEKKSILSNQLLENHSKVLSTLSESDLKLLFEPLG